MNLKELFENAEDGRLNYDQFQTACKEAGFKLADLSTGDYVTKKKVDDELAAKDSQIASLNETIVQRDSDLEDLKSKLTSAGNDVEKLNQVSADLTALQNKYDSEVKSYQEQLKRQSYEFAVREFAGTKQFTSNAAKRDFINSMLAKNLTLEDNKILGAEDFVSAYSTDNADAFYVEPEVEPEVKDVVKPQFVGSTPGTDSIEDQGGFKFNFTGVREH